MSVQSVDAAADGAMVLTSNRDVAERTPLFGDELLAGAAMDRLLHHAHLVSIEGDSYRNL